VYSELAWQEAADGPQLFAACARCRSVLGDTMHVRKSAIYERFRYAFKFVNRQSIPYPMYFPEFPFGKIEEDIGHYVNDFIYEEDKNDKHAQWMGTDWGTARGYRISFSNKPGSSEQCIALSHESGLEIFLLAAGTFVGLEVAKFTLKRTLETAEKSINDWWTRRRHQHWRAKETEDTQALVERITVRTPHWEISLDGRFDAPERERIIEHLAEVSRPVETVEEFAALVCDERLGRKIANAGRRIIRRL
jgi:hypothetical protein